MESRGIAHLRVDQSEIVNDLLLHPVHRQNFPRRFVQLLHREVEHPELLITFA